MTKLLLPLILFFVLALSCSEDEPSQFIPENAEMFFLRNKLEMQQVFFMDTYNFKDSIFKDTTFTSKGGVKIYVPTEAFIRGKDTIKGTVNVALYEMFTPSAMILSGTNTNYTGINKDRYFVTNGFIHIAATNNSNGVELLKSIDIKMPKGSKGDTTTYVWKGTEKAGGNNNLFSWTDYNANGGGLSVKLVGDYFPFSISKSIWNWNWYACNSYWSADEWNTITVNLTGEHGSIANYFGRNGDTFIYFVAKGESSAAQLYTKVSETSVKSYDNSLPKNAQGKLIAFSIRNGVYSFVSEDITIDGDNTYTLNLQRVSLEDLKDKIKTLDNL